MNKSYDVYMCRRKKPEASSEFWQRKRAEAMPAMSEALFDAVLLTIGTSHLQQKIKTRRSGY